jgi:hypothetical protein
MNKTKNADKTKPEVKANNNTNYLNKVIGIILLTIGFLFFIFFTFWIIISKLANPKTKTENNNFTKFLIEDKHYCLALPLLIPVTFIIFYFRRTAIGYFRHC